VFETVATYTSDDGKRRVRIERFRDRGWYTFTEEHFSDDPLEMAWCPLKRDSFPVCDSLEIAIREARGRVDWLGRTSHVL